METTKFCYQSNIFRSKGLNIILFIMFRTHKIQLIFLLLLLCELPGEQLRLCWCTYPANTSPSCFLR